MKNDRLGALMTSGESRADWKILLEEVLGETNKSKLELKTKQLENALFLRSQDLGAGNGTPDVERQAIKVAIDKLLQVKVEKLGYPMDPKLLGRRAGEPQ